MKRHEFKEEEQHREPLNLKKYPHSMGEYKGEGKNKEKDLQKSGMDVRHLFENTI